MHFKGPLAFHSVVLEEPPAVPPRIISPKSFVTRSPHESPNVHDLKICFRTTWYKVLSFLYNGGHSGHRPGGQSSCSSSLPKATTLLSKASIKAAHLPQKATPNQKKPLSVWKAAFGCFRSLWKCPLAPVSVTNLPFSQSWFLWFFFLSQFLLWEKFHFVIRKMWLKKLCAKKSLKDKILVFPIFPVCRGRCLWTEQISKQLSSSPTLKSIADPGLEPCLLTSVYHCWSK